MKTSVRRTVEYGKRSKAEGSVIMGSVKLFTSSLLKVPRRIIANPLLRDMEQLLTKTYVNFMF